MQFAHDIMTKNVVTLRRTDSIKKAISVLIEHRISGAPVIDDLTGEMVGLISEYDLILAVHSFGSGGDVAEAMKTKITTVRETTPITEIADLMLMHKIRRVPVVNEIGQPIGIISRREILRSYYADA